MNPISKKLLEIATKSKADALDVEEAMPEQEDTQEMELSSEHDSEAEIIQPSEEDKSYTYVGKDGELCRLQPGEEFIDPHTPEPNPSNALTRDLPVSIEDKEESMDALDKLKNNQEDISGNTFSHVTDFLEKYSEGNDIIQVLRKDLMSVLSDMQWINESRNQNEQWALDFADALNEISTSI